MTTRGDERIRIAAKAAHDAYEEYAPEFGYDTRQESAVPWEELPANRRALMCVSIGAALAAADGVSPPPDAILDLLWQAREALRLTREYVWPAVRLPAIEGWSWWDATVAIDAALGRPPTVDEMPAPPAPSTDEIASLIHEPIRPTPGKRVAP